MNPGQEQFYNFFMERIIDGKEDEAKDLLMTGFAKQDEGTFDADYLKTTMPKYIALLKPEHVEEFNQAMAHFGSNL